VPAGVALGRGLGINTNRWGIIMKHTIQTSLLFTLLAAQLPVSAQLKGAIERNVQPEDLATAPLQKATIIKTPGGITSVLPANARLYVQSQQLQGNLQQPQPLASRQYYGSVGAIRKGATEGFGKLVLLRNAPQLEPVADQRLSAIGITLDPGSGRIKGIDPASDLAGRIKLGDLVKSYDGVNPVKYIHDRMNYGPQGVSIMVEVYHSQIGAYETLYARRHPVSEFSPDFQQQLLRSEPPL
jgi:hypothetical protein